MDFEMTTTTISPTDDISASVDPLMKENNGRKQDDRIVCVNRSGALLTFFALLVSLIFLISSLVYVCQVKREWMGEITKLRSEFESMKQKNRNYAHSSNAVRLRLETSGSEISEIKIELRKLKNMLNESADLCKGLQEMQSLCLNRSDSIAYDVEWLKQVHSQSFVMLQNEIGERKIGESYQAGTCKQRILDFRMEFTNQIGNLTEQLVATDEDTTKEIERLETKLENMQNSYSNHAVQLLSRIRDWNMTYLRHRDDLQDDIAECRNLQLNETRKRAESIHSIGQSIKNQTASFQSWITTSNDTYYSKFQFVSRKIEELQSADVAKTADMDKGLLAIKSLCFNRTDAVTSDVEQLKRVDSENFVLLQNEIEDRRTGESNQTAHINKRMVDIRTEFTNQLGNLTEQLFESENDTAEEIERLDRRLTHIQNSYSNHTVWIVSRIQYWNRTYLKQIGDLQEDIAECRDLQLNESRIHKEILDSIGRRIKSHTASFESWIEALNDSYYSQFEIAMRQIAELQNADLTQSESLQREIRERTRAFVSFDNSTQNKIDHLNTSQYTMKSQLVRLQSNVNQLPTQHQIEQVNTAQSTMISTVENQQRLTTSLTSTMQSVQNTINYLTAVSKLYTTANGWRRFGSLLYKKFGDSATEQAASSTCSSHGGRLAAKVLRDAEAVRTMIRNGDVGPSAMWIGLDDKRTEGVWRSSDGGRINPAVTRWNRGEPNNSGNEDCAAAWLKGNILLLNDAPCSTSFAFLCEVDVTQT